jgi:hypothetical protein
MEGVQKNIGIKLASPESGFDKNPSILIMYYNIIKILLLKFFQSKFVLKWNMCGSYLSKKKE